MLKKTAPTIAIGIDVSKDYCDVCFLDEKEDVNYQGQYSTEKYKSLVKKIVKAEPRIVILEATGGYERALAAALLASEVPFRVVNPLRTRQFALSIGLLGKTDAIDARMLALYALRNRIEPAAIPNSKTQEIRALLDRRRQLIALRTAEKNRQHRTESRTAAKSIQTHLSFLAKEISAIDHALDDIVEDDDEFRRKEAILTSVPGVGEQTARTLIGSMPELGNINRAEAAALAGLAPFAHDSGKFKGRRMIRGGRGHVRRSLYMAAVSAVQHAPRFREMVSEDGYSRKSQEACVDGMYEKIAFATQCAPEKE